MKGDEMLARKNNYRWIGAVLLTLVALVAAACGSDSDAPASVASSDPWAEPQRPPKNDYDGPLFEMSYNYPDELPVLDDVPWQDAIGGGRITVDNADLYVDALKDYIADDMQLLLFDFENWDADAEGWYNVPWLSDIRDGIHGSYIGSAGNPPGWFPTMPGLTEVMTTHVLIYYDELAGYGLNELWGSSGDPGESLGEGAGQFPEGSIIVKPAFTTAGGDAWEPMTGAYPWEFFGWKLSGPDSKDPDKPRAIFDAYLFQFDIIVKDSIAAPESQWVFTTLVYDRTAGGSKWDQMVALGAMWGNDPDVISPIDCDYLVARDCPALSESWVNQDTPVYSRETLGWGGRLSGPNDGAVDLNATVQGMDGPVKRLAMSSCMSCHGSAQFFQESMLIPMLSSCKNDNCGPDPLPPVYYAPGSAEWMAWFQDRAGDVPQNPGQLALDYGMNNSFKALPKWFNQIDPELRDIIYEYTTYRGVVEED